MNFGEQLRRLRKDKGLTQDELGEVLGISSSTVSAYETNKVIPNEDIKNKIGDYFEINVNQLLDEDIEESYVNRNKRNLIDMELAKVLGAINALTVVSDALIADIRKSIETIDQLTDDLV
ncbi:Helix-turn-helix domain-containing protein [Peptoniphilus asaccharolyticus DSM 20463]|uniref:Helix-turn-helix domain-containing protein n=1 Tax=Peptoniphilus asaccharolyticus DSM 20463 TaxID=573058 RepID=A0A1W1VA62_PEPAS|nr:helix-turn-helix transcriptional regulator [Peptoniphilus asaccharolyticus]MBL7575760.1 helix-turn-helix transcriptional regulator [Peptoniphilus asaccharolyticus]SMB90103.1 Helix-turn-helix domain-containing protein [Peptoniphilus asaccharolyticus DSM 20463]